MASICGAFTWLGLAWFGLVWFGLAWLGGMIIRKDA
jgi:hypothetical protein